MGVLALSNKSDPELSGELQALRDVFEYNTFVRKRYLGFITRLPEGTLTKDRGASHPSILDIFVHILDVYKSWFHTYRTGKQDLPEIKGLSLSQTKELEVEVDAYIHDFMARLRAQDINRSFQFAVGDGEDKGKLVTWNLKGMLWHQVEEELQHRGEINALLWQDDIDPPVTSWYRWEKAQRIENETCSPEIQRWGGFKGQLSHDKMKDGQAAPFISPSYGVDARLESLERRVDSSDV